MKIIFILFIMFGLLFSWEGYDYDSASFISIDKGNLVRVGSIIEVYDYGDGEYHQSEVINISRMGSIVEIIVIDFNTGVMRFLEMHGK